MELPRLPIDRYRVALRLTRPARFPFHHGAAVREALARALGATGLPPGVVPCAPESGRVTFATGDRYRLGVTLVGEERRRGAALAAGLAAAGQRSRSAAEGPAPGLAGGFAVEAVEPLPPVALEDELAALAEPPAITVELLSPLAWPASAEGRRAEAACYDGHGFPAGAFVASIWERVVALFRPRGAASGGRRCAMPSTAGIEALPGDLPRLAAAPGLVGALGRVVLWGVPPEWLGTLLLGRHLHAGAGVDHGLGRYRLPDAASPEPFRPSRDPWAAAGAAAPPPELLAALDAWAEDAAGCACPALSRAGGPEAERRAIADGLVWRRPADLGELADRVPPGLLAERARAAFPLHPGAARALGRLADLRWRAALALLALPEIAAGLGPERRLLRKGDGFVVVSRSRAAAPDRSDRGERGAAPTGRPAPPPGPGDWPA